MPESKQIVVMPGGVGKVETTRDQGLKIVFYTQELPPEEMAVVMKLNNSYGWCAFSHSKERTIRESDIPALPAPRIEEDKSPALRLRNVLYRLWEQDGKVGSAEEHYRIQMDQLIDHFKNKLN